MTLRINSWRWYFVLALFGAGVSLVCAQEPAAIRRTVLPSLDSQVTARMMALDRRLIEAHTSSQGAGLLFQLAQPAPPYAGFAPLLANPRSQGIWDQMPDEYHRMIQESGDALVLLHEAPPTSGVAWSSTQVRRLCQQRLAALPNCSRELYRQRVDAEARVLLDHGKHARSSLSLRRIADELLESRYADQALDLLGDLAFERGHFDEARHWWSQSASAARKMPDTKIDLARVEAKQILASIFVGRLNQARNELERFAIRYPNAKGPLAGENAPFRATLQKTLTSFVHERTVNNEEPWTTFGGDATRSRTLSHGLSWQLWEDGPAWRVSLPAIDDSEHGKKLTNRAHPTRLAAFHPVIVDQQILIADHRSLVSYHLLTGQELFRYDLKNAGLFDPGAGIDPSIAFPRFTLSVDHERAYVRLGSMSFSSKAGILRTGPSWLVCLDLTEPHKNKKRELWRVQASADDKSPVQFEGSPLVVDGRVYIAQSKAAGRRVETSILCFDTHGRRRWSREVCDSPEFDDPAMGVRTRQHLLTWASGQIVYASHSGAIVAVDAWTGQATWGVRYPGRGPLTAELEPSPRDLAPCIYADGLVFAAPLDSDRLFCIDAVSGEVRWEVEGIEAVHLLGITEGRLLATTRTGLLAIDTASGQTMWNQPTDGRLPGLGRGLIAGRWLFWPTQDPKLPYRAVTIMSGTQQQEGIEGLLPEPAAFDPTMLSTLPVGNWAFGEGCLAIAGLSELVVYVPAHKQRPLPPPDIQPQTRLRIPYPRARWQVADPLGFRRR